MAMPTMSPPANNTFSAVIDADHSEINRLAGRLRRATSSDERGRLLREVTWRLVRHDVSEDLVMRPAFIHHLGQEGREMAEHDRKDHDDARVELLSLFGQSLDAEALNLKVNHLFDDLGEHMKVESGEHVPRLERLLTISDSQKLGTTYLHTQILTPSLEYINTKGIRTKMWKDVEEYARTDRSRFREIWEGFLAGRITLMAGTSGVRVPPKL